MGEPESLSQEEALRAVTINAAHVLGMQEITGSIRAGKKADFTVFDLDPMQLRDPQLGRKGSPFTVMVSLTLIGGYLGVGKTTLVNRLLKTTCCLPRPQSG